MSCSTGNCPRRRVQNVQPQQRSQPKRVQQPTRQGSSGGRGLSGGNGPSKKTNIQAKPKKPAPATKPGRFGKLDDKQYGKVFDALKDGQGTYNMHHNKEQKRNDWTQFLDGKEGQTDRVRNGFWLDKGADAPDWAKDFANDGYRYGQFSESVMGEDGKLGEGKNYYVRMKDGVQERSLDGSEWSKLGGQKSEKFGDVMDKKTDIGDFGGYGVDSKEIGKLMSDIFDGNNLKFDAAENPFSGQGLEGSAGAETDPAKTSTEKPGTPGEKTDNPTRMVSIEKPGSAEGGTSADNPDKTAQDGPGDKSTKKSPITDDKVFEDLTTPEDIQKALDGSSLLKTSTPGCTPCIKFDNDTDLQKQIDEKANGLGLETVKTNSKDAEKLFDQLVADNPSKERPEGPDGKKQKDPGPFDMFPTFILSDQGQIKDFTNSADEVIKMLENFNNGGEPLNPWFQ